MKIAKLTVALLFSLGSTLSQAAVFTENFDSYSPLTTNWPAGVNGWTVTDGTVDLIGPYFYDFIPGNGNYIDLDGSTGSTGLLKNLVGLTGGIQYALTFSLAGNQRGYADSFVNVHIGDVDQTFGRASSDLFATFSLLFTPTETGDYSFGFLDTTKGDNVGALLDNVSVTAVPEPETYALMLAGLGLIGFSARRRKTQA